MDRVTDSLHILSRLSALEASRRQHVELGEAVHDWDRQFAHELKTLHRIDQQGRTECPSDWRTGVDVVLSTSLDVLAYMHR